MCLLNFFEKKFHESHLERSIAHLDGLAAYYFEGAGFHLPL